MSNLCNLKVETHYNTIYCQRLQPINGIFADVLRLDSVHKLISGNKAFKLKGFIDFARDQGLGLASTGGSCSNHLHALSAAGKQFGIKTKAFVQSYSQNLTPTLQDMLDWGTDVHWIKPQNSIFTQPKLDTNTWQWVPSGGMGSKGLIGFKILKPFLTPYTHIFCASGTGTTVLALYPHLHSKQQIIAISAVNTSQSGGLNIKSEISNAQEWHKELNFPQSQCIYTHDFAGKHFSEWHEQRILFTRQHERLNNIIWDYIYTSRVLWAFKHAAHSGFFKATDRVLLIHTGGLQANRCYQNRYHLKWNAQLLNES